MIIPSSAIRRSHFEHDAWSFEWKAIPAGAGGSGSATDETGMRLLSQVRMLREFLCELLRENEELRSSLSARTRWSKSPATRSVSACIVPILDKEISGRESPPRLSNLQHCICELLIKNKDLRMALTDSDLRAPDDGMGSYA